MLLVLFYPVLGVEADPLEISIDVIEVKFHPPPTVPRQKLSDTIPKNLLHTHTHSHGYGHAYGQAYGHAHVLDKEGIGYSQAEDDNNSLQFTGFNRDGSR